MELYYVISILDRDKRRTQEKIYDSLGLRAVQTMLGRGTATSAHLSMQGLSPTEKAVMATVAGRDMVKKLIYQSKLKLFIDIPGNGVMMAVPMKSVGGAQTLEYLTGKMQTEPGKPEMSFEYELIYVILNEGFTDAVMDAARTAGARGGTVISAKGTGVKTTEKFMGFSLANEREVILIVAKSASKAEIMRAIMEKAGTQTRAGAICFSVPVSQVAGLRMLDEEEPEEQTEEETKKDAPPENQAERGGEMETGSAE